MDGFLDPLQFVGIFSRLPLCPFKSKKAIGANDGLLQKWLRLVHPSATCPCKRWSRLALLVKGFYPRFCFEPPTQCQKGQQRVKGQGKT